MPVGFSNASVVTVSVLVVAARLEVVLAAETAVVATVAVVEVVALVEVVETGSCRAWMISGSTRELASPTCERNQR
jgi:hypothetical protein